MTAQVCLVTAGDMWSRLNVAVTARVRLVTAGDVLSRLAILCHGGSSGTSGDSR